MASFKYAPQKLILIEVDSWFGSKWLGFSGKIMGRLGVWTEPLSVPPFVPARIFSQRRLISPDYTETDAGDPVHITVSSSVGKSGKLTEIEPRAAVVWYSGDSLTSQRGVAMAYIPVGDTYLHWYVS
jgi:hypothetical protein